MYDRTSPRFHLIIVLAIPVGVALSAMIMLAAALTGVGQ